MRARSRLEVSKHRVGERWLAFAVLGLVGCAPGASGGHPGELDGGLVMTVDAAPADDWDDDPSPGPEFFDEGDESLELEAELDADAACGDGICSGEESCESCSDDCGVCFAACGDGVCDTLGDDESCSTCAEDCGACEFSCGDAVCDSSGGETCDNCPADCTTCDDPCGDGVCDAASEDCFLCPDDCGACPDPALPGWIGGVPDGAPMACDSAPPSFLVSSRWTTCLNLRDAYRARDVNLGHYPFRTTRAVWIVSGDLEGRDPVTCASSDRDCFRRRVRELPAGASFAVQSDINRQCRSAPAVRAGLLGPGGGRYVFGYHVDSREYGWVPADALIPEREASAACVRGSSADEFQVTSDPYGECAALDCVNPEGLARGCTAVNGPRDGLSRDCPISARYRESRQTRVSSSVNQLTLRYSPGGAVRHLLHAGDRVRVRMRVRRPNASGSGYRWWYFVEVLESTSPSLTPRGTRGWTLASGRVRGGGVEPYYEALGGSGEGDEVLSQATIRCRSGCCGTSFNCSVPQSRLRSGCDGARVAIPGTSQCRWPFRTDGDRTMYDGMGNAIGTVRDASVQLNQGMRKQLGGQWFLYAWAPQTYINAQRRRRYASGWIAQSSLRHRDSVPDQALRQRDPGRGEYPTEWRIVDDGAARRYSQLFIWWQNRRGCYPATDYLIRPGSGLVNLSYNVPGFAIGGQADDSFAPGAIFHRSRGVPQIDTPLYHEHTTDREACLRGGRGTRSARRLRFVYGYVFDGTSRRYGWIPREVLERM